MQLKPIDQQIVVVFGATSGIGRETALLFAQRGAKVVAVARGKDGLASLAEEVRAGNGDVMTLAADASSFEQVKMVADRTVEAYGRIDTWVHVAAVMIFASFDDTTPEEFEQVIDVNLLGQIYGAKAALPHLRREGRGSLIHVSSVESAVSLPYQSAYAASKHGVTGFLDSLRMELKHEGAQINVTDIRPASINTPLYDKARTKIGTKPKGVPPFYEPRIVANAILYAAEHEVRDIIAGGAGKGIVLAYKLAPALTETLLSRFAPRLEHTSEHKSSGAPDNLDHPLPGNYRSGGSFSDISMSRSAYTWLVTHPAVRWALTGALLLAVASAALLAMGRSG